MALGRQVQPAIGGVQVGMAPSTVGQTPHRHLAEHGAQHPLVVSLHRPPGHALGVGDLLDALLPLGSQLEMALQSQAQHLPAVELHSVFQLGVGHGCGLLALKEAQQRLEPGTAFPEGVRGGSPVRVGHRGRLALAGESRATSSARPALPCSSTRDLAAR